MCLFLTCSLWPCCVLTWPLCTCFSFGRGRGEVGARVSVNVFLRPQFHWIRAPPCQPIGLSKEANDIFPWELRLLHHLVTTKLVSHSHRLLTWVPSAVPCSALRHARCFSPVLSVYVTKKLQSLSSLQFQVLYA